VTKQLLVLGCSQTKRDSPGLLPAIDRYDGSAYRVLRNYLRECEWPGQLSVAILSAKYGLVGGLTEIELYDQRMTKEMAASLAPGCTATLTAWASEHSSIHLSLGKDYLPAVQPAIDQEIKQKADIFDGPIGMKLAQIKGLLEKTGSPKRRKSTILEPGSGNVSYFLPDWDDLLDERFDFEGDRFSGKSREDRNDKHCCVLMKPKRMCDGVVVSLAQHVTSKGPLRRIFGTESNSLAPRNLRSFFGLDRDQLLFGDCGAFSYVNEQNPEISVEQAVSLYELHGFDFGASVDHIPVECITRDGERTTLTRRQRLGRVRTTIRNADSFIELVRKRNASFTPVGTIQGLDAKSYGDAARVYHDLGYRHLAIGGLVPLQDAAIEEIVTEVMRVISSLKPRPWVHLFGVFRPKLQPKFRQLKVDSFDSASYFRKAWLRSDQNYLGIDGKWYAALRVPMTSDGRTRKKLEQSGIDPITLEAQEKLVLKKLSQYGRHRVGLRETVDAVIEYDECLTRSSDARSMRAKYERTLTERPWEKCDCPFCKELGIHALIFRGSNRNKRRGAHNTLMLYGSLCHRSSSQNSSCRSQKQN
jgi:hypothetical protein